MPKSMIWNWKDPTFTHSGYRFLVNVVGRCAFSPLIDSSDDASLCGIKKFILLHKLHCSLFHKNTPPNTGILIPFLYYQNMKNLVFS